MSEELPNFLKRYDIRGPNLTKADAYKLTSSIAQLIDKQTIVVGKDQRDSSNQIFSPGLQGFYDNGVNVVLPPRQYGIQGFATTDMIAYLAKERDTYGLMFSPSHMPEDWAGIKPLTPQGRIFNNDEMKDVATAYLKQPEPTPKSTYSAEVDDKAYDDYLDGVIQSYEAEFDNNLAGQKIIVDPGNAAGVLGLPDVLSRLGADVEMIHENIQESPQRSLEPKKGELGKLEEAVLNYEADIGLATDGDADRVVAVNNNGNVVPGSQYLALVGKKYVENGEESIACSVNTSSYVEDVISDASGTVEWTPLGAIFTALTCIENDISFGGQPNGHMMNTSFTPYDSAAVGGNNLAGLIARDNVSLAERQQELPDYHVANMNIDVPDACKDEVLRVAHNRIRQTTDTILSTKDGIKSRRGDSEYLVRGSGTEPIIRIYAGSSQAGDQYQLANDLHNTIVASMQFVNDSYDI